MSAIKVASKHPKDVSSSSSSSPFKAPLKREKHDCNEEDIKALLSRLHSTQTSIKDKEGLIVKIGEYYRDQQEFINLDSFIRSLNEFWIGIPRARAAKLIKTLLDDFHPISSLKKSTIQRSKEASDLEIILSKELIKWAEKDKRAFLKQALESRLAELLIETKSYTEAITVINRSLVELKKVDDKLSLTQTNLLECQLYFELKNMAKAKAALTAARTCANSIYCPPIIQGRLDYLAGLLHADEGDFRTAYSYFVESVDSYGMVTHEGEELIAKAASESLKLMFLCKIALNQIDDIDAILAKGKASMNEQVLEAMKAVGKAYKEKSLKSFHQTLLDYPDELQSDLVISAHFDTLYNNLMTENLLSLLAPYSRIQLSFLASEIGLEQAIVESKLSMMILDGKLNAILDQEENTIIILKELVNDKVLELGLNLIKNLESVVDGLYQKATSL